MSPPADESRVAAVTTDDTSHPGDVSPVGETSPVPVALRPSPVRSWSIILLAGLLAGLVGFGIGEAAPRFTPPDLDLPPEIVKSQTKKIAEVTRRVILSRDHATALTYGALGMALGMALGAAGGLVRRSAAAAVAAGVAGLVLGGAAGAGSTLALLPSYHASRSVRSDENRENNLALALMTHGVIWGPVGAAAGLALGVGLGGAGRTARAVIGGLIGALLGAAIYEFAGAIALPIAETFRPVAITPAARLLAHLSVSLCTAIGALTVADHVTTRRAKTSPGR